MKKISSQQINESVNQFVRMSMFGEDALDFRRVTLGIDIDNDAIDIVAVGGSLKDNHMRFKYEFPKLDFNDRENALIELAGFVSQKLTESVDKYNQSEYRKSGWAGLTAEQRRARTEKARAAAIKNKKSKN